MIGRGSHYGGFFWKRKREMKKKTKKNSEESATTLEEEASAFSGLEIVDVLSLKTRLLCRRRMGAVSVAEDSIDVAAIRWLVDGALLSGASLFLHWCSPKLMYQANPLWCIIVICSWHQGKSSLVNFMSSNCRWTSTSVSVASSCGWRRYQRHQAVESTKQSSIKNPVIQKV